MKVWELIQELAKHSPDEDVAVLVSINSCELPCPACTESMGVDAITAHAIIDSVGYSCNEVTLEVEVDI